MLSKTISNLTVGAGLVILLFGGFLLFSHSSDYNRTLDAANIETRKATPKPTSSGLFSNIWTDHKQNADTMLKFAKEKYDTDKTKDIVVMAAGGVLLLTGVTLRKKETN